MRVAVQNNNTLIKDSHTDECMVQYKMSFQLDFILLFSTNTGSPFHTFHPTVSGDYNTADTVGQSGRGSKTTHHVPQYYTQAFIKTFISKLSMKNNQPRCCSHLVYKIYYIFKKCSKSLGGCRQPLVKMHSQSFITTQKYCTAVYGVAQNCNSQTQTYFQASQFLFFQCHTFNFLF